MKSLVGFALVIVGIVVIVFGMYQALRPVVAMYQEAMTDPMGTEAQASGQPDILDSAKDDVPKQMFRGIAIGAVGLVPLLIGSVLVKIAIFQRLRRSKMFAPQAHPPGHAAMPRPTPTPTPIPPRPHPAGKAAAELRDRNPFQR
jgi:hypothetical protein